MSTVDEIIATGERMVRRAMARLEHARRAETALYEAVRNGDTSIDHAALADAAAEVRLHALRVEAAQRLADETLAEHRRGIEVAAGRRRQKAHEQDLTARRANWQRAIDSGLAADQLAEMLRSGPTLHLDPEYLEFLREKGLLDSDGRPVIDARTASTPKVVGNKLRDAAVDPKPGDRGPTNAGKADPHGPEVFFGG